MSAIIKFRKQEFEVKSDITVRDAMLKLEFEPDAVIPTRDGELIPYDELIGEGETIRLVPVISGGGSILGGEFVAKRSVRRSCVGN